MNLTYKLGILVALIISTLSGSGQSKSYQIFDEFANKDGFTYLAFSKSMIDAVDLKLDDENKKVTGDLKEIRILIIDNEKANYKGSLAKTIAEKFDSFNYRKVEPNDSKDSKDVEFWIEGNSNKVKECHVIVKQKSDSSFSCLVSFYGNFKVEDLENLEKFSRSQASK